MRRSSLRIGICSKEKQVKNKMKTPIISMNQIIRMNKKMKMLMTERMMSKITSTKKMMKMMKKMKNLKVH